VTIGSGKFYSNGLDLEYGWGRRHERLRVERARDHEARAAFPAYTVAALNGHAFGAGAQVALAHDARVMRTGAASSACPRST
jgi:enoyl-CoA hydratase/carnithine racemase